MNKYQEKTLEYFYSNGRHIVFYKYTIDTLGIIKNKLSGKTIAYKVVEYQTCGVLNDVGKKCTIRVGRAVASTFLGQPPENSYTADHINSNDKLNDTLENIRWLDKIGQTVNQKRPEIYKKSFIIVKDDIEKTIREWVEYLKDTKTPFENNYTSQIIHTYSKQKMFGFSYKEYPNIEGEVWLRIKNSENSRGYWEISNMCRVKQVMKHASIVLSGNDIGLRGGYPVIGINGKLWNCHVLSFATFYPDEYVSKKANDVIMHINDDKLDFRPHMLRLGSFSENSKEAHDNGKHHGKKTARMKCASYVNGVFEKEHASQVDAALYLRTMGYEQARGSHISTIIKAYKEGDEIVKYGRTWKTLQ